MEEGNSKETNKEFIDEFKKLFESMSGLNIEHERTLNVCYGEYFDQKVKEFEQIEKHIGSFVKSFSSKASDFKETQMAGEVIKEREEFLFNTRENFDFIKTDIFGMDRNYQPTCGTAHVQIKPTSGDNFSEFILNDNCGKYRPNTRKNFNFLRQVTVTNLYRKKLIRKW